MLVNLTINQFLEKTAGNEPVPGGGSISALNAALAASLTAMVANVTLGKKKYESKAKLMENLVERATSYQKIFATDIDADADAYNQVFEAFKLPKETEEEKIKRNKQIQDATKIATEIPMRVARTAYQMMDLIDIVAKEGNQNAITDACVAMMAARTAILGALMNVQINLASIEDETFSEMYTMEVNNLKERAIKREIELLTSVMKLI